MVGKQILIFFLLMLTFLNHNLIAIEFREHVFMHVGATDPVICLCVCIYSDAWIPCHPALG